MREKIASSTKLLDARRRGIEQIDAFIGEFRGYLYAGNELSRRQIASMLTQLYQILECVTEAQEIFLKLEKNLEGSRAWQFFKEKVLGPKAVMKIRDSD